MPWKGPSVPGEYPTLGYQVADWIEARCAIPDREFVGEPFLLTDEQLRFLLHFYRLDPTTGSFVYYRGAQLTRPQKWGKGPLSAAVICAEAQGPVLFDGWDANGEPVGKPWPTPLIQVTAVSEDQADNVYSALLPMIELGALHGEIEDTGLGRINLPHGGKIEPVTASGRSRLGQRVTFIVQDQTESYFATNGGRVLADNQRRNIAGMGGRWLSTPNAWDPTEESVAQYTAENERDGVYHDDVLPPEALSIRNKTECLRALRAVYGDSCTGTRNGKKNAVRAWINIDRIYAEIQALVPRDPAQAERFYLNRKQAAEAKAFNGEKWDEAAKDHITPPNSLIVVGVDGARFADAIAVVACEIATGHLWPLGIWERPENAAHDYEHPMDDVDEVMRDAFDVYDVWRVYIDPGSHTGNIAPLMERWMGRWGDKRIFPWEMYRNRPVGAAVANFTDAIATGSLSHNGDPHLTSHVKNAVRKKLSAKDDEGRELHSIQKDRPESPRKIDAAAAAVLAWECRGDAIEADASHQPSTALEETPLRDLPGTEPVVRRGDLTLRGDRYIDQKPGADPGALRGR